MNIVKCEKCDNKLYYPISAQRVSCECGNIINPHIPAIIAGSVMKPLNSIKSNEEKSLDNILEKKLSGEISSSTTQSDKNTL